MGRSAPRANRHGLRAACGSNVRPVARSMVRRGSFLRQRRRFDGGACPRLRGPEAACGRDGPKGLILNLRRKATCLDSTHRACATTQLGTTEESRTNARSDPTPRRERKPQTARKTPERRPPGPWRPGTKTACPGSGCTYGAKGMPRAPACGGPTGQLPGPQAVTRRSDARPQAMAPGPHPST